MRSLLLNAALASPCLAQDFTPLFNGKDLTGWWGASTEDPRHYMALSDEDLAAKKNASLDDIHAHWTVEDGVLVGIISAFDFMRIAAEED